MAKRMTLDETWDRCLEMWKWVSKRAGHNSEPYTTAVLKEQWFEKSRFKKHRTEDCFFCDYASEARNGPYQGCQECPGKKVISGFHCEKRKTYHWGYKPVAFYNKLVSLNRKRLKGKKHV